MNGRIVSILCYQTFRDAAMLPSRKEHRIEIIFTSPTFYAVMF